MRRAGYRYRTGRAAARYVGIAIGSGIGGLCAAALQSRLGRKVCMPEQHYTDCGLSKAGDAIPSDAPMRVRHPARAARVLARAQ